MPTIQIPQGPIQLPYDEQGMAMAEALQGGAGAPEEEEDDAVVLGQIMALLDRYRQRAQSQQALLMAEKASTLIQQILATEEKEADGMLQGKLSPSAVRRSASGF